MGEAAQELDRVAPLVADPPRDKSNPLPLGQFPFDIAVTFE